ncbi:hypothetical protein [Roseovarius sp. ZX-A-9]|uniref:hypothetical protein n=1 Tax=Roseovarius sp. ZX-A-9 TaxID=3014783 RepID=UPI00232C5575|nr:hypothetical protein [Roseovarius sp. ZX-A-9]
MTSGKQPSKDIEETQPAREAWGEEREALPSAVWDVAAAVRLVEAVREAGGRIPGRFQHPSDESDPISMNRWRAEMSDLADSVSFAFSSEDAWPDLTMATRREQRLNALAELRRQFEATNRVLSEKPVVTEILNLELPPDFPSVDEAVQKILEVVTATTKWMEKEGKQSGNAAPLPKSSYTAQGMFLRSLASTYREFFSSEPLIDTKKTWEAYQGPFVSFVRTAYAISGQNKTDAALTKALQRAFTSKQGDINIESG